MDLPRLLDRVTARYLGDLRAALARVSRRPWPLGGAPDCPVLAAGVQLSGELRGSGFAERQWLVERDGRFIQLTELLYRVLEHVDGRRTRAEIATGVSAATGRLVSAEQVRLLIERKLAPAGLVLTGPAPGAARAGPLPVRQHGRWRSPLAVRLRLRLAPPGRVEPLARVLQVLYAPSVLLPLLLAVAVAHVWLYGVRGLDGVARQTIDAPGRLAAVFGLVVLANGFHELGHAAALRYGGGRVRGIGVGFYLFYPVFYADVTDSYRLGRWARLRVDLGGFYFHLLFALGSIVLYALTGYDALLLVVVLLNLEMLHQCLPFVRLDGYWALADLTGIPDFFSQLGPFLRTVLPLPWWHGPRLPRLKRWVQLVFAAYLLITGPLLALLAIALVRGVPGLLIGARVTGAREGAALETAFRAGNVLGVVEAALSLGLLALTITGLALTLVSLVRPAARGAWLRVAAPLTRRLRAGADNAGERLARGHYRARP